MSEDRRDERREDRQNARLRSAREATTLEIPRVRLESMAAGLRGRQQARRQRRMLLAATGACAGLAMVVLLGDQGRRAPQVTATSAGRSTAVSAAPSLSLPSEGQSVAAPAASGAPTAGRLPDLAAEPAQASERWATYVRSPDTNVALPNVSYAGYHQGETRSPRSAHVVNVKAAPFSAVGDGVADDTAALRKAIDSVERTGGVVYLPDGDYRVSGVLFVHGDGTVLRGESQSRTRLLFTQPLDQAMGPSIVGPYSRWEWAGGLLWFAPRSRQSLPGSSAGDRQPEFDWARQGWPLGQALARVIEPAGRGDRTLVLADTSHLAVGDLVFLVVPATDALIAAGWHREPERGLLADRQHKGPSVVRWPVEISSIHGNIVSLAQPLRFDVGGDEARTPYLQGIPRGTLIRDVGVERLTLVMRRQGDEGRGGQDAWRKLGLAQPFGWNGLFFLNTVHGFARQITVVDGDLGAATVGSKNVTLEELQLRAEKLPADMQPHRGLAIRAESHDVLVDRVRMDRRWTGVRVEGSGFVLSRAQGLLTPLNGRPVDAVLTEITDVGGAASATTGTGTVLGHRVVGWNLRAGGDETNAARAIEPRMADGQAAPPRNLYDAQKRLRLGERLRRR